MCMYAKPVTIVFKILPKKKNQQKKQQHPNYIIMVRIDDAMIME